MSAPIDYTAVLADLEAKRGQIDAAIAVIRSLVGAGAADIPQVAASPAKENGAVPPVAPPGAPTLDDAHGFRRMSTAAAVKKYLTMMNKPQTVRAIADAMRAGNQAHAIDDKTAYTNVYTALKRGLDTDFYQARNKEWELKAWRESAGGAPRLT